jgi:hypothetical protein
MKGTQAQKQPELKMQPANAVRPYQRQQYVLRKETSFKFAASYTAHVIYNREA